MNYAQQLKHPEWQKKRLEIMEINNWRCEKCFTQEKQLNIHHTAYRRGALLWQYKNEELQCLCNKCHKDVHKIDDRLRQALSLLDIALKHRVLGYVDSLHHNEKIDPDSCDYFEGLSDFVASVLTGKRQRKKRTDLLMEDFHANKETTSAGIIKRMNRSDFL